MNYLLEQHRIYSWNQFLTTISNYIHNLDTTLETYKISQKILYYNTYVIGIATIQSQHILLPKSQFIHQHKQILFDDILYNWSHLQSKLDNILEEYIKQNKYYRR